MNQSLSQESSDRSQLVAFIVAVAFFMENLDGTAIATALPQMALSFGVSPAHLSIGITAYLVTLAIFIPISGWIADRFGARTVFGTAIAVFTIASVFCGVSSGLIQFILARILQGIGGAMMVPVGRVVVLRSTPKNQLIRAIATITWPGLIATVIGPPVGGFITTYFSWHWIFLINVPIGLAGIVLVRKFVTNFRSEKRRPLDLTGFLLGAVCLSCLMYGVELLGREDANWSMAALFLLLSLVFGWFTIRQERRTAWPIFDFSLLKIPTYALPLLAGSLTVVAIGAAPFLLPLMFQTGFGMSPFESGLLVLVYAAGNLLMKTVTTRTLKRFGFRAVLLTNTPLIACFAIACGLLAADTPVPVIAAVLLGWPGSFPSVHQSEHLGFFRCSGRRHEFRLDDVQHHSATGIWNGNRICSGCTALRYNDSRRWPRVSTFGFSGRIWPRRCRRVTFAAALFGIEPPCGS